MFSFEGFQARKLNKEIFELIQKRSYAASEELAQEYGEPEMLKGYGRRNTTLNAIAPTTSSAFILGQVSQSIEPYMSNCYVKDVAKLKVTIKNPYLEKLLEEKDVFKTFCEIDQMAIIYQAADRQQFTDQSQSLNVMISPKTPAKEVNYLYIQAWKLGIKTLYYQHSMNAAQQFSKKIISCSGCEA